MYLCGTSRLFWPHSRWDVCPIVLTRLRLETHGARINMGPQAVRQADADDRRQQHYKRFCLKSRNTRYELLLIVQQWCLVPKFILVLLLLLSKTMAMDRKFGLKTLMLYG